MQCSAWKLLILAFMWMSLNPNVSPKHKGNSSPQWYCSPLQNNACCHTTISAQEHDEELNLASKFPESKFDLWRLYHQSEWLLTVQTQTGDLLKDMWCPRPGWWRQILWILWVKRWGLALDLQWNWHLGNWRPGQSLKLVITAHVTLFLSSLSFFLVWQGTLSCRGPLASESAVAMRGFTLKQCLDGSFKQLA